MFGILPLLFALGIAQTANKAALPTAASVSWMTIFIFIGLSVVTWLIGGELIARLIGRGGRRRWLGRWDLFAQGFILAWYTWLCYSYGWSARSHNLYSMALAPWLLMQFTHWWAMTPAVRAVTGHAWTRFGFILQQLRFGILPMLLIMPCFDVGTIIASHYNLEEYLFSGPYGFLLAIYSAQLFLLFALVIMPFFLLPLWGAKQMPEGELADFMRQACNKLGVRIAGLRRWPIPGGRVYNAAVIGLVSKLRYVLFTDDLIRALPREQILAVLGHELGHARHGHMWMYFLFANAALWSSFFLHQPLANLLYPGIEWLMPALSLEVSPTALGFMTDLTAIILIMAVMWRLVFGVISRMCERQADLVGAELAGNPLVMCDALKSVARLSGQGENEPSWRHYSIAQRVDFLREVHRTPLLAHHHHIRIRMLRHFLILLIIALILASSYIFDPSRMARTDNPNAVLTEMSKHDRDLAYGLQEADAGNHIPLAKWLNRNDDIKRQRVGYLILRQIEIAIGTDAEGDQRFDDRPIYKYRYRLRPFFDIRVGTDAQAHALERQLDNTLAYGLVAGIENPTEIDLKTAQLVLPRLEKAVEKDPHHSVYDTIGCVYFCLGDFTKSVAAFEQANKLFNEDKTLTEFTWFASDDTKRKAGKIHAHLQALYARRLEAARANAASVGAGKLPTDSTLVSLPRDLGEPLPEPAPEAVHSASTDIVP